MIPSYLFWNLSSISMFELEVAFHTWMPDGFKDCQVQQQLIFDRQLRFAAEQPVHFAKLDSKLFSLDEYMLSAVGSSND